MPPGSDSRQLQRRQVRLSHRCPLRTAKGEVVVAKVVVVQLYRVVTLFGFGGFEEHGAIGTGQPTQN